MDYSASTSAATSTMANGTSESSFLDAIEVSTLDQESSISAISFTPTKSTSSALFDKSFKKNDENNINNGDIKDLIYFINSTCNSKIHTLGEIPKVIASITKKLSGELDNNDDLSKKNQEMKKKLEDVSRVLIDVNKENQALKELVSTTKTSNIDQRFEKINELYQGNLKSLKDRHEKEITSYKAKIHHYKEKIKTADEQLKSIGDKTDENARLLAELKSKDSEIQLLNGKLDAASSHIHQLKKKIDELQNINIEAAFKNDEIQTTSGKAMAELHRKVSKLRKNISKVQDERDAISKELNEEKVRCALFETTIHDLTIKLNEKSSISEFGSDSGRGNENLTQSLESLIVTYQQRISSFEDLFSQQTKEIQNLQNQKQRLSQLLTKMMDYINHNEPRVIRVGKEEDEALQYLENNRSLEEIVEFNVEQKWKFAFEQVMKILPEPISSKVIELENVPHDSAFYESVQHCVEYIHDEAKKYDTQISDASKTIKGLRAKYTTMFCLLENLVGLLRSISTSSESNDTLRQDIIQQCHRCSIWMDDNKPSNCESSINIFHEDAGRDPETLASIVFSFIDEGQEDESPFAEIVQLLGIVTYANSMLMRRNEQLHQEFNELSCTKNRNADLAHRLEVARNKIKSYQQQFEMLYPQLLKYIPNPTANGTVEDVIKMFCDSSVAGSLCQDNFNELSSMIEKLHKHNDSLKAYIEKLHSDYKNERKQFCEEADAIINTLYEQVKKREASYKEHISDLSFQIESTNRLLKAADARASNAEQLIANLSDERQLETQDYANKLRRAEERNAELHEELEIVKEGLIENQVSAQEVANLQGKLERSHKVIEKLGKKAKMYQEKLRNMVPQHNDDEISQIKRVNEELSQRYLATLNTLNEELSAAKKTIEMYEGRVNELEPKVNDLLAANERLHTQLRSSDYKRETSERHAEVVGEETEARLKALQMSLESQYKSDIAKLNDVIEVCRKSLGFILASEFSIAVDKNEDTATLAENIKKRFKEKTLTPEYKIATDALRLQKSLKRGPSMLLSDYFNELRKNEQVANQRAEEAMEVAKNAAKNLEKSEREINRMSDAAHELSQWVKWARNVYRRFKDDALCTLDSTNLRYMITEFLMVSVSYKTIERRLSILRFEKNLYISKVEIPTRNSSPLTLKSTIVVVMFSHRLLEYGGFVPAKFALRQQKSLNSPS